MPLDLAYPRTILPFPQSAPPPSKSARTPPTGTPAGRPAIQLKLSEDVLAQLVLLARSGESGGMRIDLSSSSPAFIVNGVAYPLNLSPESPHTELVRLSPDSRNLVPIATVSHKASLKPGAHTGALAKVSLSLRENREQAEKEREGRRAVLLDPAPNSRSSSHSRVPLANGSTSRNSSPAPPFHRRPSRLSAVPAKPPPAPRPAVAPIKPPTSSFRIGKGALPTTLVRSTSSDTKPVVPNPVTPASTSTPVPVLPPSLPTPSLPPPSPTPHDSASSTSSNGSSSLPHQSSSTRTSLSSAGSPPSLPAPSRLAGGGGILQGKDSLKKVVAANARTKDRGGALSRPTLSSEEEAETLATRRREEGRRDEGKKKRKLLNGVAESLPLAKIRNVEKPPTPISSPRPRVVKTESPAPGTGGKKRGRKVERDYSSSEEEEGEGGGDRRKRRAVGGSVGGEEKEEYPISGRDEFEVYAQRFEEEWVGYNKLWRRLEGEKRALGGGGEGEFDLVETDKLVKRCEKMGKRLRGIKEGLKAFVLAEAKRGL